MLRNSILYLIAAIMLTVSQFALAQGSVVVIVNESNQESLDADKIKHIYSDHITHWKSGKRMDVYNLPVKSKVRKKFSQTILGISARAAQAEQNNRKITNTVRNPQKESRERMVVFRVSKNPDAIGYVSKDAIGGRSGIRIVHTIP